MSHCVSAPTAQEWLPTAELEALHATLAATDDEKIPRLLAIVDRLEHRGPADAMIAPFRLRISQLGIARPLRFVRLLFAPLDPVVVPPADWQVRSPLIPRNALPPMADMVRQVMGPEARRIEEIISGHTTHDHHIVDEAGPALWTAAAQALVHAGCPQGWTARSGLPPELFQPMACRIGTALGQIHVLQTWHAEALLGIPVRTSAARNLLHQVNARQPEALGLLFAVALARLPQAAGVLRQAIAEIGGRTAETMLAAMEAAAESLLSGLEAASGIEKAVLGTPLRQAGAEVSRILRLIACVDRDNAKPARRARLAAARRRLSGSAQLRFTLGLQKDFLQILESPAFDADTNSLNTLEEAARGLWELASEAARVGNAATYETLVRQTTDAIRAICPGPRFTLAAKVRLVEILAGSDEAWALLTEQSGENLAPA